MSLQIVVGPAIEAKLVNVLGRDRAEALVTEILPRLGLVRLASADDRLHFGRLLAERGGVLTVIGHSIQTQALLQGAFDTLKNMGVATPSTIPPS